MGKRGPVARGGKRTSGLNAGMIADYFPPTEYLSDLAKQYWQKIVASFADGHFTEADRALLEQYCEAAALHRTVTEQLQEEERKYQDRYGKWHLNPLVKDQHQTRCDCAMLATKLRITKQSRISPQAAGVSAEQAEAYGKVKDAFGDLLFSDDNCMRQ